MPSSHRCRILKKFVASTILLTSAAIRVSGLQCWKDAYYRGVGLAPYCADPTWILYNKICYAPCIIGYQE